MKQYKAFDFGSGNTYLIGRHPSKTAAMGYCKANGIETISKTCVPLTDAEYEQAYENRRMEPWEKEHS